MEKFGMMKRILPMLAILLGGLSAMAQSGKIYGTVRQNGEPQPGLKVMLMKEGNFTGIGQMTNDKGEYTLSSRTWCLHR
ncbi:MAG: hypothetical protein U0176_09805 [Bacteroidia bacterium]